jgi:hypothetical protein
MLGVKDWERTPEVSVEELMQRFARCFSSGVVDKARGDAHIKEGLDRLIAMGAPDVILKSHRSYFGNTVFVSVSEPRWRGATATSYLQKIWPPLGDSVLFDIQGADDELANSIARELAAALDMVVCSETPGTE